MISLILEAQNTNKEQNKKIVENMELGLLQKGRGPRAGGKGGAENVLACYVHVSAS